MDGLSTDGLSTASSPRFARSGQICRGLVDPWPEEFPSAGFAEAQNFSAAEDGQRAGSVGSEASQATGG